jgi:hypothetical protein
MNQVQTLEQLTSSMTWGWIITLSGVAVIGIAILVMTFFLFVYGQFSGYPKERVIKYSVATTLLLAVAVTGIVINQNYQTSAKAEINRTFSKAIESKYGATVSIQKTDMIGNTNEVTRDGQKTLVSIEPFAGEWVIKDITGNLYPVVPNK